METTTGAATNANPSASYPSQLRSLRRDLNALVALESLQLAFGLGVLVAISVHSVVVTADRGVAGSILLATLLALIYLALAFRIRAGEELLRRDLHDMELCRKLDISAATQRRSSPVGSDHHPYRSSAPDHRGPESVESLAIPRRRDHLMVLLHIGLAALTIIGGVIFLRGIPL
jgi:hypothetical protein